MSSNTNTEAAADAVTEVDTTTSGETPSKQPLTETEARELLRKHSKPASSDRDPLEDGNEVDPLLSHSEDAERDPLGERQVEEEEEEPGKGTEATTEETTAGETPEKEVETAGETAGAKTDDAADAETNGRRRLNIFRKNDEGGYVHSPQERAAMQYADDNRVGFMQAWKELFSEMPKGETKAEEQEVAPVERTVATIDTEIKALRAERKTASQNLDTDKASEITEKIEDLLAERQDVTLRAAERSRDANETARTSAQQHEAAQTASMDTVAKVFPEAVKVGTKLNMALGREIARIEKSNPAFFHDPEWPETLTAKLAIRMGISPASATKTAAKPAPAAATKPVPPKQAARPAPAPGGVSAQRQTTTQHIADKITDARARGDLTALQALMKQAKEAAGRT